MAKANIVDHLFRKIKYDRTTHNRGRICHLHNAFAINGYLICVISIVNQGQNVYIACANIIISRYARHARAN